MVLTVKHGHLIFHTQGNKQGVCTDGLACVGGVCSAKSNETFQFNIVHMNDIHAHFDEISLNSGRYGNKRGKY